MNRRLIQTAAAAGVVVASAFVMIGPANGEGGSNVTNTRHNLTASGPGEVKTTVGGEACRFCHTPHASNPVAPLWNRRDSGAYYQTYESSTLQAQVGQPTGSSRLCLSCHDGTIALAQTYNARNSPGGTVHITSADRGYIGTDLRDDHPISFTFDAALATAKGELADPNSLPPQLQLDRDQQLQCTTCHDVHDDSIGQFLRMTNDQSQLCVSCHRIDSWTTSAHAVSNASLDNAQRDDWANLTARSVQGAGCESCHRSHSAGGRQRLLRHAAEEDNCFNCHDGTVASTDIAGEFQKISRHPVSLKTGVHDPTEDPNTMIAHVECADCHNSHRAKAGAAPGAPFIKPVMAGVAGLSSSGRKINEASNEYEVCYRCHSDQNFARPVVDRLEGNNNIADEFDLNNASFHPVEGPGVNTRVPSLLPQYTTTSVIYCTSCHGSDDASGPAGPHGSRSRPLLIANYSTQDRTTHSTAAYAVCYKCHSETSILRNDSFRYHKKHIQDKKTPCSVCHDPHGSEKNAHLINFDQQVVKPLGATPPTFVNGATDRHGSCTLSCHGEGHNNENY